METSSLFFESGSWVGPFTTKTGRRKNREAKGENSEIFPRVLDGIRGFDSGPAEPGGSGHRNDIDGRSSGKGRARCGTTVRTSDTRRSDPALRDSRSAFSGGQARRGIASNIRGIRVGKRQD